MQCHEKWTIITNYIYFHFSYKIRQFSFVTTDQIAHCSLIEIIGYCLIIYQYSFGLLTYLPYLKFAVLLYHQSHLFA